MDKIIFYHTYLVGDYKTMIQEQLTNVFVSGLYDECTHFYLGINQTNTEDFMWVSNLVSKYNKITCVVFHENNEERNTFP